MKRTMAAAMLCSLFLSGCTQQTDVMEPTAEESAQVNPQMQALEAATEAGLLQEDTVEKLTEEQAQAQVAEGLDETQYTVTLTDEALSVGADTAQARDYYVFAVSEAADGRAVGKVAVDCETGEKYHYLGDGVLDSYTTFPLYDAAAAQREGWPGRYVSAAGVALTITQADEDTLSYLFSDGTAGEAAVSGETAKSADERMNFLLADGIVTVAGGGLTGNYAAQ